MTSFKRHFTHFSKQHSKLNNCDDSVDACRRNPPIRQRSRSEIQRDNHFNQVAFKEDICNCATLCSDYIQSLNALCGSGNALGQRLIQVFSRDLSGLLAEEGGKDDLFAPYYTLTENFLAVWEGISVATAGASARLKTETLMSLQDVINRLETVAPQKAGRKKSSEENVQGSIKDCLRATRNCLLSYVELQAQFAYSSWTSLDALSKLLRNDPSMGGILDDIKHAFSRREGIDNVDYLYTNEPGGSPTPKPVIQSVSSPPLRQPPTAVSRFSMYSSGCTSEDSDSFGLEDAINLLSLNPPSNYRCRQAPDFSNMYNQEPTGFDENPNLPAFFDDRLNNPENKPSTWPGKKSSDEYRSWDVWPQLVNQEVTGSLVDPFPSWNPNATESSSGSRGSDASIGFDADTEANVYAYVESLMELQQSQKANKRLSCSSDGINLDQGLLNGYFTGDLLGCNNLGAVDARTTKTSTWPLKQVSPGTMSPPPFERQFNHECLLSAPIAPTVSENTSTLWPFVDPKTTDFK